jgi:hypothetical protein
MDIYHEYRFRRIRNDDRNSAKRSIDAGGVDGAGSLSRDVHHVRVGSDGGTGMAGTSPVCSLAFWTPERFRR